MTSEQIKASKQLNAALNKCAKVGLSGGVYDGTFCIWPSEHELRSADGINFFQLVDEYGEMLFTPMALDGGAGT